MNRPFSLALGIISAGTLLGLLSAAFVVPAFLDVQSLLSGAAAIDRVQNVFLIVGLVLTALFVFFTLSTSMVPAEKRWLWVVVLVLANVFALPFFWLWYVRPYSNQSPPAHN